MNLADQYRATLDSRRTPQYFDLLHSTEPAQKALNDNPSIQLMFMRPSGMPVFYRLDNLNAAKTVRTWDVWPTGVGGGVYGLDGSNTTSGNLAVWDGAGVRLTHQEFGGRVTQKDSPGGTLQHSTHVAGTLVAAGVNAAARGMSYAAPLDAYDWNSDTVEMATAAANGLEVSSHSYGYATGWEIVGASWYWYGDLSVNTTEDWGFGFYDDTARQYDNIAFNAPDYLICFAAGNDRNDLGPTPGGGHYHWNGGWVFATDTHGSDAQNGGYDTISWGSNAKDILTIGAINDITLGYSAPSDVVMTAYSSWGPTDDGRIKPDIVANGQNLYSCDNVSDFSYITLQGTSMATPNAAGSINLIAQEYKSVMGATPLSSTLKALVINGADEAGTSDGPDYRFGWGLLDTKRSIDIIHNATGDMGVVEGTLTTGNTDEYTFFTSITQDIRVTLVWTDPPGTPPSPSLDPTTKMLVNDLDVTLVDLGSSTTTYPWMLNGTFPPNAATKGVNHVDNVEQIDLPAAASGHYKVTVSHTGSLSGGSQDYSLVWRGMHTSPTGVGDATRTPSLWIGTPYPNPVAGTATIEYGLDHADAVTVHVYDVSGRLVATLLDSAYRAAGPGTITLNASGLSSGIYFVKLQTPTSSVSRKITVVK